MKIYCRHAAVYFIHTAPLSYTRHVKHKALTTAIILHWYNYTAAFSYTKYVKQNKKDGCSNNFLNLKLNTNRGRDLSLTFDRGEHWLRYVSGHVQKQHQFSPCITITNNLHNSEMLNHQLPGRGRTALSSPGDYIIFYGPLFFVHSLPSFGIICLGIRLNNLPND